MYTLPLPTTLRFFFQTKLGLTPPFTVVAVKITAVPAQLVNPGFAITETAGVTFAFTTNASWVAFAIFVVTQVALEVSWQSIVSPFTGV